MTALAHPKPTVPRLKNSLFTFNRGADNNHVFLYTACDEPPFVRAAEGWKIIGHGVAPYPKGDSYFAAMFEKQTPAANYGSSRGEDMDEGSLIWHHYNPDWLKPL